MKAWNDRISRAVWCVREWGKLIELGAIDINTVPEGLRPYVQNAMRKTTDLALEWNCTANSHGLRKSQVSGQESG